MKEKILEKIHSLGIPELTEITSLNELDGSFVNMECKLPNGLSAQILDDNKKYYGTQVEQEGSERCYGIAADDKQIAVYEYGCNGIDAELIAWLKL